MQSRIGAGTIVKLSGEPWPHARVCFELLNNILESCDLVPPQCQTFKSNSEGLIEAPLLVGGTYRMKLSNGQAHEFTVAAGSGSFCLWDAVVIPPVDASEFFLRLSGGLMQGDIDLNSHAIANASIDSSNIVQFLVLPSGVRPTDLELGQTAYGPTDGLLWVGTGSNESFAADGSQIIPSPSPGKGWREFSLVGNGGGGGGASSELPLSVISEDMVLTANREYWAESLSLLNLQLPTSATTRDRLAISGFDGTTWRVTQAAGQIIQIGNKKTTSGVSGRISALENDSRIELTYKSDGLWFASFFSGNFEVI